MIDAVYDVSVAYPYNTPTKAELDTLKGDVPPEVHFHTKRYPISDLPTDKEALTKWCEARWAEKEEQLKKFYTKDKCFIAETNGLDTETIKEKILEWTSTWTVIYVLAFWGIFISFAVAGMMYSTIVRGHFLIACVFYVVVGTFYGGVESLAIRSYNWVHDKPDASKKR